MPRMQRSFSLGAMAWIALATALGARTGNLPELEEAVRAYDAALAALGGTEAGCDGEHLRPTVRAHALLERHRRPR